MRSCLVLSVAILFSVIAFSENKTVYTKTGDKDCEEVENEDDESESYIGECPGTAGFKLHLLADDDRESIDIITPNDTTHELDLWSFYTGFSDIGETVEWRTKNGVPVALIARYNVANADSGKKTSYLMVAKVGKNESCVVDFVPPGKKQNEKARQLADASSVKACKSP